ncbi:TLD-domain-containing protein [Aspergillus taichungensis]|uniref:Oxidation resistance protein 1 n=1 Tax=Aspergillus taichungensis TaxID=482145 RepID=A0A2J5HJV9_9EURO|nr:TLD-domain-containing protein [Aspergillus taichungensis]
MSSTHRDPQPPARSSTPGARSKSKDSQSQQSTASYFSYPVSHVMSGLYRRLTDPPSKSNNSANRRNQDSSSSVTNSSGSSQVFTPVRTVSPFQPPPLTPLTLTGGNSNGLQQQLLTHALAEEIRLLVPARLQLSDTWRLAYSLDRDGASLSTLYDKCSDISDRSPRAGYVLVVRDSSPTSAIFGAYMTDPPHPDSHYFGTGECFLWRASVLSPPDLNLLQDTSKAPAKQPSEDLLDLSDLPPPPSADTTNAGRTTTLRDDKKDEASGDALLSPPHDGGRSASGTSTPDRIRFKAFPYSGVNDYMMFCETGFLSLGGGDGRYGLWLDSSLEKGVSDACQTFGNEPLSDEGTKFDLLGVEVWYVGA